MKTFIEILGWYGTAAILLAYALISFSVLDSTHLSYQLLNATGAMCILVLALYKKTYQVGVLNFVWALIALVAILNIVV